MKKILFFIGIMFISYSIVAQAPQKFNYQAVARDDGGNTLSEISLTVRIGIINSSILLWQEDHEVVTSKLGQFSIVIGDEGSSIRSGGILPLFSSIPWGAGQNSIEVSIDDGSGFISLGEADLNSVPYAMYAEHSSNSIVGIDTSSKEALFEVKRSDGVPVFAVYNTGVVVYVDETTKGVKGGFAVGGYNSASKGISQEYLHVTPDSIRMYIADPVKGVKGVKGGFAVGGYNSTTKGNYQLMSITSDNYLIGQDAGLNITTGVDNSFLGNESGFSNETGSNNIFLGKSSGYLNTAGANNIFVGNLSGRYNTDGEFNTYIGYQSGYYGGYSSTAPSFNTYLGYQTGFNNRSGQYNTYIGFNAGYSGSGATGSNNVMIGDNAGAANTSGSNNIFLGNSSGANNQGGINNVFIGRSAGFTNSSGLANVFIGDNAGYANVSGSYNTIMGYQAGHNLTGGTNSWDGAYNTIIGYQAGHDILKGFKNVLIGYQAGYKIRDNRYNIIIGEGAGYNLTGVLGNVQSGQSNLLMGLFAGSALTTGSSNIFMGLDVGYSCDPDAQDNVWIGLAAGRSSASSGSVFIGKYAGYNEDSDNKLIIQTGYTGADNETNALVYGDFSTKYFRHNGYVGINHDGNSGWALTVGMDDGDNFGLVVYGPTHCTDGSWYSSDLRLKKNIVTYTGALQKILSIRGVSYNWRSDEFPDRHYATKTQVGVIAQEVEDVIPEVVGIGPEGYKSVDYSKFTAVLIEGMKEQQQQIELLESKLKAYEDLDAKVHALEVKLRALDNIKAE